MPRLTPPTPGSRIAAWVFPALTMWLGLGYIFGGPLRTSSTAFDAAQYLMPIQHWGFVFVAAALVQVCCLLMGSHRGLVLAMCFGMGLYACWSFLFACSLYNPQTSLGAPAWPLAIAALHVAFLSTVTRRRGA